MTIIEQLIPLADAHQAADEYRAGRYEFVDRGKGLGACAIGCTIRDAIALGVLPNGTNPGNHRALAAAIGIPEWSLHLVDDLFERLPRENRPAFTPAFLRRARNVADWKRVKARFLIAILDRCSQHDKSGSCSTVAALWRRVLDGEFVDAMQSEFADAERTVRASRSRAAEWAAAAARAAAAAEWAADESAWAARVTWAADESAWAARVTRAAEEEVAWATETLAQRDDLFAAMESEAVIV